MTPFDCPRCGTNLTMSERQGIEIDYCPQCRGVWLDRGELDKILDRGAATPQERNPAGGWTQPAPPPSYSTSAPGGWQGRKDDDDWDDRRESHSGHHGYRGKQRKGWLSELFD